MDNYGLDLHGTMILEEYRERLPLFSRVEAIVKEKLVKAIEENKVCINAIETRIKSEKSLAGKLNLKGGKYETIEDVTDIVGARVITFYTDDVDKISGIVDKTFKVDWAHSVDKRKMHELNSFGYNSLHYICTIPESLFRDPECPELNKCPFEIQMRTALQHVWATMDHDTGYKSGVEIPQEYLRNLNRLAGMLELADEQFSQIRTNINNYRYNLKSLVSSGKFEDVSLNGDSFRSYLELKPFDKLTKKIASLNQAEIFEVSVVPYLSVFKQFGLQTLADLRNFIKENEDDAFHLAVYQLSNTDLDIISSAVAVQNLCIVFLLKNGAGVGALKRFFDSTTGASDYNQTRAEKIMAAAKQMPFMNK